MNLNIIYNEDCLGTMARMPDNFIDLTVTSPPYDNLRLYHGYTFNFEGIAGELYRVTKQGGVVVWVVGDATIKGSETGTSFKQALYFKEIGFNLHDTMIYKKKNPIPLNHNRYEQSFEFMFVLSKGKPKTFNPLREDCLFAGQDIVKNRTFYQTKKSETSKAHKNIPVKTTKIRQNIFEYSLHGGKKEFIQGAIFPEQLAIDHIKSWSNEGDTILDCFMGSGTTATACINLKRNYIGSEISKEYYDIAIERIGRTKVDALTIIKDDAILRRRQWKLKIR